MTWTAQLGTILSRLGFIQLGVAPVHPSYTATGGLVLGGTATVTYRPAVPPVEQTSVQPAGGLLVRPIRRRLPPRHYRHTMAGGLVLGGTATVTYRPATRRYAYVASGGLELGGAAQVAYARALTRGRYLAAGGLEISGAAEVRYHDHRRRYDRDAAAILGLTDEGADDEALALTLLGVL